LAARTRRRPWLRARRNPTTCSHGGTLKAAEGQFGAAYKGSLINLGVFKTDSDEVEEEVADDTDELDESVQAIEVTELSSLGKRLAEAFAQSVRRTAYVSEGWAQKKFVESGVLKQFGARAGLCEIDGKWASDRGVLRSMFFARDGFRATGSHLRRRMSLLLVLDASARRRPSMSHSTIPSLATSASSEKLSSERRSRRRSRSRFLKD